MEEGEEEEEEEKEEEEEEEWAKAAKKGRFKSTWELKSAFNNA